MVTSGGQVDHTFGPRGLWWVSAQFYGCGMKVTVQYSIQGVISNTSCPADAGFTAVDTILAQGTGTADRGGPFPNVSYTYEATAGAQSVTVTRIGPFRPVITADKSVADPWETITFTASTDPVTADR